MNALQKPLRSGLFDRVKRHAVDASGTAVASRHRISLPERLRLAYMYVQPPETPFLVSLRLEIYSPPQVLQTYGRLCHLVPAFLVVRETSTAGRLRSTGVTPPQRYYTPIRHPLAFGPFPGVAGYRTYLAPAISRRGEEGFSSCLVCPCHRAAATTPPKWASRLNQISTVHAAFALRLRARKWRCAILAYPSTLVVASQRHRNITARTTS